MISYLKIFFVFIAFYFVLHTIIVFGIFDGKYSFLFSFIKDFAWFCFVFLLAVTNFKQFKNFVKAFKTYIMMFFALIFVGLVVSFYNHKTILNIIVGIKYDLLFLFLLLSGIFVGFVLVSKVNDDKINQFIGFVFKLIVFLLFFGFIWQTAKFISPNFFYKIGFGNVGDFVAGTNPPIYYRTGKGGVSRLSGIFAGPNNYGYFLVLFFSFFVFYAKNLLNTKTKLSYKFFILIFSYIFSVFATISRGAIFGVFLQTLFFIKNILTKKLYKYILGSCLILMIGVFSFLKLDSTIGHIKSFNNGLNYISQNPIGYGLGASGPSIHYGGEILPENLYFQILIDIGVVGFLLWAGFFALIFKKVYDIYKLNTVFSKHIWLLGLGLLGLFFEGLFLHVFEDSSVNYLFFVFWGVLIGYNQANEN